VLRLCLTAPSLLLVLATLKKPGHFLLCGDSNQIVHPNFFSWSQVKRLFWRDAELARRQEFAVLTANFRNGREATRVANTLLKIKHRRFGSIDRESNFLVDAIGGEPGQVVLMADKDAVLRELDKNVRQSTRFAVLVMRDEDKAEARKLELQGKQEQAAAIRRDILRQSPVPWPVTDEARLRELLVKTFRERAPSSASWAPTGARPGCRNSAAHVVGATRRVAPIPIPDRTDAHATFDLSALQGLVVGRPPRPAVP